MKKSTLWIIIVVAIIVVAGLWVKGAYNRMITQEEAVSTAWSQVENAYQRRADLIPNLVSTVKGYAAHESQTLEDVINARSRAIRTVIDPSELDAEELAKYQSAQGELSSALGRLLMISENYPDLKANQNFLQLQAQLEGTENRISVERKKFNEASKAYNTTIRKFPTNIIAGMFDFEKTAYFKAEEGSERAPEVNF